MAKPPSHAAVRLIRQLRRQRICSEAHVDQIAEFKAEIDSYLAPKEKDQTRTL
jgi:hypothetical protein